MRILHIITSLELGGAEKLLGDLIPAQKKQGEDVELLVLDMKDEVFLESFLKRGIKVHKTEVNNKKSYKNIFEIIKILKKENYDVVHSHLIHSQIWTALAKKIGSRKELFVTTEHSTSNRRREKQIFKLLDKFIYGAYEKIIAISEGTAESLIRWIKIDLRKIEIIPNGVPLREFMSKARYRQGDKLIMISRFHPSKDHVTVLRALDKLPKNYTLTFIGEGETEDKVKREATMLKLGDRVQFLGYSNSVKAHLKRHDIAIQSSNFEGFGISALEAMASGTPIIASNVTGLSEIVDGAGLVFEKGNEVDLVDKILLLEDKEYYYEKSKDGIKRSLLYSIENTARKYIALYKGE
nr:glycosyltransferase [uncultured Cetobacterium sp.]